MGDWEYQKTLMEQIHNKRARNMVAREIRSHIEDLCEEYEASGMSHEKALEEAVLEMGDPIETGMQMNQIHRPRTPYGMLGMMFGLICVGIVMQGIIFSQLENRVIGDTYLRNTILFNLVSMGIIAVLLHVDYSFLGKYAYGIYIGYLITGLGIGIYTGDRYVNNLSNAYFYNMLFPLVFAGILYRNREQYFRGILVSVATVIPLVLLNFFCFNPSLAGLVETGLVNLVMLGVAIRRGYFGVLKKQACRKAGFLLMGSIGVLSWWMTHNDSSIRYISHRFFGIFNGDISYSASIQRELSVSYTTWGYHKLSMAANTGMYSDYILSSIFYYFGIVIGILVLGALGIFVTMGMRISFRQSNRLGLLVGIACTFSVLIRICSYILINYGFNFYATGAMPLLSYGLKSCICNGILLGLLLCVFRNQDVIGENMEIVGALTQDIGGDYYESTKCN